MAEVMNPSLGLALFDIDGTVTGLPRRPNRAATVEIPLIKKPGLDVFTKELISQGIDFGGFVSRRPGSFMSRLVTRLHFVAAGVDQTKPLHLAGTDQLKARYVAHRARGSEIPVGIIDDNPHKVGTEILDVMQGDRSGFDVSLGVVERRSASKKIEEVMDHAQSIPGSERVVHDDYTAIHVGESELRVVELGPYSEEAAEQFAGVLTDGMVIDLRGNEQ